jgi:hypothetical protein
MAKEFISIQEAADLSRKSVQTIRRAIKAKKIKFKRRKTPQGFNYWISRTSIIEVYKIKEAIPTPKAPKAVKESIKTPKASGKTITINTEDFQSFAQTMEKLISQHSEERQSFLQLVNTLQDRIFVLENQLNLLKAPQKSWYQFWK